MAVGCDLNNVNVVKLKAPPMHNDEKKKHTHNENYANVGFGQRQSFEYIQS